MAAFTRNRKFLKRPKLAYFDFESAQNLTTRTWLRAL
jgi:hypothetical protein